MCTVKFMKFIQRKFTLLARVSISLRFFCYWGDESSPNNKQTAEKSTPAVVNIYNNKRYLMLSISTNLLYKVLNEDFYQGFFSSFPSVNFIIAIIFVKTDSVQCENVHRLSYPDTVLPYFGKRKQVTYHPNFSYWHFQNSHNEFFFQAKFHAETLILLRDM